MKSLLIIDLHSILHNVKHGVGKTTRLAHEEIPTFVIYGFLYKLRNIMKSISHDTVVFACDSDTSKRKEIFAGYKNRKNSKTQDQLDLDEAAYPQFAAIKNYVLPTMGFKNVFEFDGYEADDVIARICLDHPLHSKIIATSDEDMYQLLDDRTWILKHDNMKLYGVNDFKGEYGIDPSMWIRVKAYGGCSSDTVPGLMMFTKEGVPSKKGIGKTTALKYLRGEYAKTSSAFKSFSDTRNKQRLKLNKLCCLQQSLLFFEIAI